MTATPHPETDDEPQHETLSFPFDRMTVARFREEFPRARWSETLQAWTVPGSTARRRIDRWLASEMDRHDPYEQERGRDAYEFEPILSPYLEIIPTGFRIRTPYSRTVVDELRQIPFARWNGDGKVWEVPYASYDDLQHRWEAIEDAARRAEPEERRKRAEARKGTEEEAKARRRTSERRKRRLPVPSDDLPPLDRPVATAAFGIVVITEITGEIVNPEEVAEHHPDATTSMSGPDGGRRRWRNSYTRGRRRPGLASTSGSADGGSSSLSGEAFLCHRKRAEQRRV